MKLKEISEILKAEVLIGQENLDIEIGMVCGADLLSDVLAFTKPDSLLLTGLTHPQVIRTAEIAEVNAVCFVRGKRPPEETVELAKQRDLPLLCTSLLMYESCGLLYEHKLAGCSQTEEIA